MNFTGNVLQTLEIISKFSQTQIKTIEAALSSSPIEHFFTDQDHQALINCHTPSSTWTGSEYTTTTTTTSSTSSPLADFDDIEFDALMNNLPKGQQPLQGSSSATAQNSHPSAGGQPSVPPAVANQFAEYLAMQQQAQQLHQQQTQLQNQAVANAAAAGQHQPGQHHGQHYLGSGSRAFDSTGQMMKTGPSGGHAHGAGHHGGGGGVPVPPLTMSQVQPPQMMGHGHPQAAPPPLATVASAQAHGQGPLQQHQQQQQRQPLALTSNVPRSSADPVQLPANNDPSGGSNVHTTTVKLSYQQKEVAPVSAAPVPQLTNIPQQTTTTNPNPVLPPLHPLSVAQPANPTPSAPVTGAVASAQKPTDQIAQQSPTPMNRNNTKPEQPTAIPEKKSEGLVPPLKLVINSPTSSHSSNSSGSGNNNTKSPVKTPLTTPLAIVTTPSKTSMKLATVTTPRIKQTARKNQSVLQRSPTNLASISPPKQGNNNTTTTTPVKGAPVTVSPVPVTTTPNKTPVANPSGSVVIDKVPSPVKTPAPVQVATSPVVAPSTPTTTQQRKREPKTQTPKVTPIKPAAPTPVAPVSSAEVPVTPVTPASAAGKTKRNRIRTVPYQIPTPEITLAQKLSIASSSSSAGHAESPLSMAGSSKRGGLGSNSSGSSDSGAEDKLTLFYKNEFVAVRNAEDGFFLCQVLQNVYKSSPKIRIRWLSETKKGVYVADFYDVTDLECILTNVELDKGKGEYALPKEEQTRIENILKKAMGLLEVAEITEDNPDGLDLSIYKDEAQLDRKEEKKAPAKKETTVEKKVEKTPKSAVKKQGLTLATIAAKTKQASAKVTTKSATSSPVLATKRASNGVAKKAAATNASPVTAIDTIETPTRVSQRARAIQSPNYRDDDDDDDLPLMARISATTTPTPAVVQKKAETVVASPAKTTPVKSSVEKLEKTKANTTAIKKKATEVVKKETLTPATVAPVVIPKTPTTPIVTAAPASTPATPTSAAAAPKKGGAGKAATGGKTGPKPKVPAAVKEIKQEVKDELVAAKVTPPPPAAVATPKGAKKTPGKRKAAAEETVVPVTPSVAVSKKAETTISPVAVKKAKLGSSPGGVGGKKGGKEAPKEESLAALAESTKKATAAAAAAQGSPGKAVVAPVVVTGNKKSPGASGKGRGGGRGKK